jgi:hypothetical protein
MKMKEQLTFKAMILNELDNGAKGLTADELAEISGYSSGSNLRKVLRDEKKEFEKFTGLIKIAGLIWEKESIEMMIKHSTEVDPKKKAARNFLEYLVRNREFEAFNNLLDKMDECSNKESNEYAKIYRLQYEYELAKETEEFEELLKKISATHVTISELKVYKNMLLCYCFDQISDYTMTKVLSKEIELELEKIENEYIKEMYMIRYNEVMSYIYLRVYNNPDKARGCADKILESNAEIAFKGFAYYIKGYSYMFTSHEKAMGYLNKSVSMYEKLNRTHDIELLNKDIEFVNIFWGKCDKENTLTIKNQVFLQVSNNKKVDIVFLEEVKEQEFKLYFEGCMNKDNKKLMLSLIKFIKKNDLFLANIPRIALIRNGYDEEILDEMISMQVA